MLTTLVENHEKDISNLTNSLDNILAQIEEIENRPVPTTTQAPTFNGPLSKYSCNKITKHSMASANLNKSEEFVTNTTATSKYIPRRPRISIN